MKNRTETIRRMVTYLNNPEKDGGFWLPNIQRSFVWNEEQMERLFDSIMREYPISTLLVWRTKSKVRHRKFIDNYQPCLKLSQFAVPEDERPKFLVLDGQQRLQSLFIGLVGSYERKELFFDVLSGDSAAPEDVRYRFKFMHQSSAEFSWVKFKDIVFSNEQYDEIAERILEEAPDDLTSEERRTVRSNIARVVRQFCTTESLVYQELDSVDNPKLYGDDDVVEIFIRANAGGTQLSKSDLLFSLLVSAWEDADERMEELLEDLNRTGYAFTRDFVLKTCLSILNKGARYDVSKFRDESTREEIIVRWDRIADAIRQVKDFLYGKTFLRSHAAFPSYLSLIPLVYFCYHFPEQWKEAKGIDEYILRPLIAGAFGGRPDSVVDRCTRLIAEQGRFDVKEIFAVIRADGRSLEVSPETLLSMRYGSKYIHLVFNLWYRDFNYTPAYQNNLPQVDHIFPQSLLRTIRDPGGNSGRRSVLRYKAQDRDQIANLTLLRAEENGAGGKGSMSPEAWFADKPESYLEMHLIPRERELWRVENYERFIERRKELILERFKFLLRPSD